MRAKLAAGLLTCAALVGGPAAFGADVPGGSVSISLVPREATVGDPIQLSLAVELPAGARIAPPDLTASLGRFNVSAARWSGPTPTPSGVRFTWSATLTAYETGTLEVPALEIPFAVGGTSATLRSEPQSLTIRSVLAPEEQEAQGGAEQPEIRDLKPEASVAPNLRPLRTALVVLLALLALSAGAWWLQRRYAARFAAVAAPADPFGRMPPHLWAYRELQRLLEERLPESGRIEPFYAELARILKLYLGGRYRVELMEHTTQELVPLLEQAGAPATPVLSCRALLERCDLVKFARLLPALDTCRSAVEGAYRIVDVTKPVEEVPAEGPSSERGAA